MEHEEEIVSKAILYDLRQDQTLIGKCKVNGNFEFIHVNDVLCDYFKCTKAELIGRPFTWITLPDDNPIDTLNAQAVKDGKIDNYQFVKRYKPEWLPYIVYTIIDVIGVRTQSGEFDYYDVEILEISKQEYLRLKRSILKDELGNLKRLLSWTGALNAQELKGMAVWIALIAATVSAMFQIKVELLKELLADLWQ